MLLLLFVGMTAQGQRRRARPIKNDAHIRSIAYHSGERALLGCWDADSIHRGAMEMALLSPFSRVGSLFEMDLRHRLMTITSAYPMTEATRVQYDDEILRVLYPAELGRPVKDSTTHRLTAERRRKEVGMHIAIVDSLLHVLEIDGCPDSSGGSDLVLRDVLRRVAALRDTVTMLRIQLLRGNTALQRGDRATARQLSREVRDRAARDRLRPDEGSAELLAAECDLVENDAAAARRSAVRARALFAEVEDPIGQVKALYLLARIARADVRTTATGRATTGRAPPAGGAEEADALCREALEILSGFRAGQILSGCILLRAQLLALMQDDTGVRAALRSLQGAIAAPLRTRLETQLLRGWIAEQAQRPFEAREFYRSGLGESRANEFRGMELRCLTGLAEMHQYTGENGTALRYYHAADSLARLLGDTGTRVRLLRGMGDVFAALASFSEASPRYHAALELCAKRGDLRGKQELLLRLADMHLQGGHPDSTRVILDGLVSLRRGRGAAELEAAFFLIDAALHRRRGHVSRAQASLSAAFQRLPGIRTPRLRGEIHLQLARLAVELGQTHAAAAALDSAMRTFDRDIAPRERAEALLLMADIDPSLGSTRGSTAAQRMRDDLRAAFALLESARTRTARQDLVGLFQIRTNDAYIRIAERMLDECVAEDEALRYLETLHSRQLFEALERSGIEPDASADVERLREEEDRLFMVDSLRRSRMQSDPEARNWSLDRAIAEAERELRDVQSALAGTDASLNDVRRSRALRIEDIQQVLDPDEAFIEYAVFDSSAYAFVIRRGGPAHVVRLPTNAKALRRRVDVACARFRTRQQPSPKDMRDTQLHDWLLRPLMPYLGSAAHLILAPGPQLGQLPFEAIPLPVRDSTRANGYLVEHFSVSYIHSGAVLRAVRMRERPPSRPVSLFAVGDPAYTEPFARSDRRRDTQPESVRESQPEREAELLRESPLPRFELRGPVKSPVFHTLVRLPGTGREVRDIARLFTAHGCRVDTLLAEAATAAAVLGVKLADYTYLHFACHGFAGSPPTLALAPLATDAAASSISLADVLALRLDGTRMVALSACNTALGEQVRGEGAISLNRAFLATGCRNVLSTLWSVHDEPTSEFILRVYRAMIEEGRTPREALRTAKLMFIGSERYSAPCYWAPFVVYGDGR